MSNVNIVIGLSGVGKSTVLEEAMLLSEKEYEVINYGDKMLEIAKEEELVNNRDEMKNIEVEKYKEIQKKAAEQIVEESKDKEIIVDTHAAIKSPYGYIPGLPKWTLENLDPSKIIIIDASASAIVKRAESDSKGRERDTKQAVEDVEEYREVAREMAATGSVLTGAYLQVIENKDGKVKETAQNLLDTLQA